MHPTSRRWTQRPPGSTWGDWGPDDELGRLNLLTSEKVLQGIAEVASARRGRPAARAGGACCAALPLHEHCLFKLGVHLGELRWLTPLAQHLRQAGRSRFLLTAPPLRLPGAVASPVTPVGTT